MEENEKTITAARAAVGFLFAYAGLLWSMPTLEAATQVGPRKTIDKPCKRQVYGAFLFLGDESGDEYV
ncbi:hypothetical protein DHC50_17465 [Arenibacter sp. A80]|nr:hypothetical protein [Arenibacter sp. A80]RFT54865.1 hypothetical protein D0S24_17460 [Arenibacter sp. P308M17]